MATIPPPKQELRNRPTAEEAPAAPASKPMTVGQQVALTIKLLVGGAVLMGLLWLLDRAT